MDSLWYYTFCVSQEETRCPEKISRLSAVYAEKKTISELATSVSIPKKWKSKNTARAATRRQFTRRKSNPRITFLLSK